MKPKKIFSKLFPSYFLISALGLAILLLITRFALKNFYFKESTTNLLQKAKLIEKEVIEGMNKNDHQYLQRLIKELAKISENRITIVLPSGDVIADSSFDPKMMENHLKRKEVESALKGKVGKSVRFSPTLKENHLYVAIPLKKNSVTIGILRNAVSVDKLQTSLTLLTKKVLLWSFLLLIILTYFIYSQAKKISSPLEEMKKHVEVFASGNFQEKISMGESSTVEISSLISAIETMSNKLQTQFLKINNQKNEQLAMFSSMLEGVVTVDQEINIYHINRAALSLFNYQDKDTFKGIPLREVIKSERIFQMAKKLLEDKKTAINEFEYESGMILNVHGTILHSNETDMLGAVLVFNDVTKMRELENHRKQFVANVSHELKTPLTAIQGFLETIKEGEIEDQKTLKKFINIIYKHSMRLKIIIEDLLTLSSIEKESEVGELILDRQKINPVIEDVISLCQDKAKKKGINLKLNGESTEANVNIPLLEQAIINLLDNAIKYGPNNSTVIVNINKLATKVEIVVSDEGNGIEKKHHERLFERFYSVDKARSRELGGSGLGLSIVKHIALSHGGKIRVESEIGHGSSFIFELPS